VPVPTGPLQLPPPPQLAALLAGFCVLGLVSWSLLQAPPPAGAPAPPRTGVATGPAPAPATAPSAPAERLLGLLPGPETLTVGGQNLQFWPPKQTRAAVAVWLVAQPAQAERMLPLVADVFRQRDAGHVLVPMVADRDPGQQLAALQTALTQRLGRPPRLALVGGGDLATAALAFLATEPAVQTAIAAAPRHTTGLAGPGNRMVLVLALPGQLTALQQQFAGQSLVQIQGVPEPTSVRVVPGQEQELLLLRQSDVVGWLVATLGPVQ
jgi:hypothetical protein